MRRPPALDAALAAGLAVWWLAEVGSMSAVGAASLVLTIAPLAWRRRLPLAVAVLVSAGFALSVTEADPPEPVAQLIAVLVAAYSVALHAATWRLAIAGGAASLCGGLISGIVTGDIAFILALLAIAWGAGAAGRRLRERSAEIAAAQERERIARELHDLVSHSVSLMVVQAGAAEQVLHDDPDQATRALRAIQDTGRSAVDDLRRMLGLLRAPADADALAPQPGLDALDGLVASHRAAGVSVELERGALPPLDPGLDLAAYRIVQEALTNAAKHAPRRPTTVRIDAVDGRLTIEARTAGPVVNGRAPGTGNGLFGMRERARLYGGDVTAGPDDGDWLVQASIPVRGA